MNKKHVIALAGALVATTAVSSLVLLNMNKEEANVKVLNKEEARNNSKEVIISDITAEGYVIFQGDSTFFKKGIIPYNAQILDKIVYKNKDYKLNQDDIQYELAQGYVIKINDNYYYYPKENVAQTNIITKELAIKYAKENPNHEKHHFKIEDIVSEDKEGYVVRHGDHYHYVYKRNLTPEQIASIKNKNQKITEFAGVTHETSDGYIFKGENDIIGKNNLGVIVKHGEHEHFIPYEAFKNTKWDYLVPENAKSAKPIIKNIEKVTHTDNHDHYIFDPKDIVSEDENGYVVAHGDHYHYIKKLKPTPNNDKTVSKPEIVPIAKPAIPDTHQKTTQPEKPSVEKTPVEKPKPSSTPKREKLIFAGIDKKTSDDFLFDGTNITKKLESGLLVGHGSHTHFIPYFQLVESPWEHLIPENALAQAKAEYEKEYNKQHNKEEAAPSVDENPTVEQPKQETPDQQEASLEEEIAAKKAYLAQQLGLNPEDIQVSKTEEGVTLLYPHHDHFHSIPLDAIDLNTPIPPAHAESAIGMQTLKKLGFDDDIIHDLLHADADMDFPNNESNPEKMKEWLKTVKGLNIGQNKDPLKRNGLDLLPNIEVLGIGFTPIDDITPVYQFKKLKQLYVTKTGITNYDFIKNIPTLEGIDFSENNMSDISFLRNYPNLKIVAAAGNNISDISPLTSLKNLKALNLDYNNIEDISALTNLPNLKAVSLEHNNLTNLAPLNNKSELINLFVSNNPHLEIDSLHAENLQQLDVNSANIYNLDFIKNLPNLEVLNAENNNIETLKYLDKNHSLKVAKLNNNKIRNLSTTHPTLEMLEVANNVLENLNGIENLPSLKTLIADHNNIESVTLPNPQNSLKTLQLNNNRISSLQDINNYSALTHLEVAHNFISTLTLPTPNTTITYLNVGYNTIPEDELRINPKTQVPVGIETNFKAAMGGAINNNYALTKQYVLDAVAELQERVNNLYNEKVISEEEKTSMSKELHLIDLDISYALRVSQRSLQSAVKTMEKIENILNERLREGTQHNHEDAQPQEEATNDNETTNPQENTNAEHVEAHPHEDSEHEHHFEFTPEMIESEDENGYVVRHDDHFHYVLKKDLTPEQLEAAKTFLENKKASTNPQSTDAEIQAKIDYIALLFNIPKESITRENNVLHFMFNGKQKEELLDTITIPAMSDDLEADFEKEIEALAKQMDINPDNIKIKDGVMEVPHGNHSHFYKIQSPGWIAYLNNRLPHIDIPVISGNIDDAIINKRIVELENSARKNLKDNPRRLRKALKWLQDFRENSVPWRVTSTEGYLSALNTFEQKVIQNP